MPGEINGVAWADNVSFSATQPTVGILVDNGDIVCGNTAGNPLKGKLPIGQVSNLSITLSAGLLSVASGDGTALSATNPGFITLTSKSALGTSVVIKVTRGG